MDFANPLYQATAPSDHRDPRFDGDGDSKKEKGRGCVRKGVIVMVSG